MIPLGVALGERASEQQGRIGSPRTHRARESENRIRERLISGGGLCRIPQTDRNTVLGMEWKLRRLSSHRIKTDEDMLWENIMKTLARDLRKNRKPGMQKGAKTPDKGKSSYSRFKSSIVKRLTSKIPCASSPIATRWQQMHTRSRHELEHSVSQCLTFTSSSSEEMELLETPENVTAIPAASKLPFNAFAGELPKPFTCQGRCPSQRNRVQPPSQIKPQLVKQQKLFYEMASQGETKSSHFRNSAMEICEPGICTKKGCRERRTKKAFHQVMSEVIPEESAPLHPALRIHITGLRNDYYLNLLDWSSENLIALALDSSAHIWDGGSRGAIGRIDLSSSSKYISSVSWINEGSCLALGTSDGEVQLWDIETKQRLRNMLGHVSVVGALDWNQHILSSGSRLGYIHHHDVRIPDHCVGSSRHKHGICSLKWSPGAHHLASGSSDGTLNIWPNDPGVTPQCKPMKTFLHSTSVKAMDWCPWLSETLAVGGGMKDGFLRIWDVTSGTIAHSTQTNSQICSLLWLPETKELVTGHGLPKNHISMWNYPSLTPVTVLYGHKGRVLHLALSPDRRNILSTAADGMASVWQYYK